ncbi:MAG: OmpA family protein [bacterium]
MYKKTKITLYALCLALFYLTFSASAAAAFSGCAPRNVNANWPTSCGFAYNCCIQNTAVASSSAAPVRSETAAVAQTPAPKPKPQATEQVPSYMNKYPWLADYNIQANSNNIHFALNKSSFTSKDKTILKRNAIYLKYNPDVTVQIQGNCDRRGSESYNLALGWRRANAAKAYLENLGINADRLKTVSYGKEKPLCNSHTSSCYAINRRDHFAVVSR